MNNQITNQEKLGIIGENLYILYFGGVLSDDKFDSEKDIIEEDGTKVEIKTQPRWKKENCFTLNFYKKVNYNKCLNVDKLIFIEPTKSGYINFYEAPSKEKRFFYTKNVGNTKRYCMNVNACKLIKRVYEPIINEEMIRLTRTPIKYLVD
jgi:hypothetical protein